MFVQKSCDPPLSLHLQYAALLVPVLASFQHCCAQSAQKSPATTAAAGRLFGRPSAPAESSTTIEASINTASSNRLTFRVLYTSDLLSVFNWEP